MIKKLKLTITSLLIAFGGFTPLLVPVTAGAAIQDSLCSGSQAASGDTTGGSSCQSDIGSGEGEGVKRVAANVVNLISIIVGIISVIFIIYGGFRYITSGGDSGKVGNAKNTLIYAVIGLIVVALAQIIVNVVLTTTNSVVSSS